MRVLCVGDNVVDRYVDRAMMFPGGNCVNVAVYMARLGASASYLGVLGDDAAGELVLAALQAEGVDTSLVRVQRGANAYALVQLEQGDRLFLGSDKGVSLFELTDEEIRRAAEFDLVHTAYTSRLTAQVPLLTKSGCRVVYDFGRSYATATIGELPGLWMAAFSGAHLPQHEQDSVVAAALAAGATYVLITLGALGARMWSASENWFEPAANVVVADTLGAGDAFLATVAFHLLNGVEPALAMRKATDVAADVVGHMGAFGHGRSDEALPVNEGVL